ncbi:barstar family protein [Stenotrophomonas sp. S48]|nr:barstar family protein [Stenotrophomonas sp. S48]MBK0046932.1 barstar family protein [Stenotrophomonas sp. S49]
MHNDAPLELVLEGSAVHDIASFYAEINRVFMVGEDWQLGPSLDALDDLLYGGYGVLAGHATATLVWKDIAHTRHALGEATTRAWLQDKLDNTATFNTAAITRQLRALQRGEGETYFEIVMEIFVGHPNISLRMQ